MSIRQLKQLTVQLPQSRNTVQFTASVVPSTALNNTTITKHTVSFPPQHQTTQQSPNTQCHFLHSTKQQNNHQTHSVILSTAPNNTTITKHILLTMHNSSSSINESVPRRLAGYSRNLLLTGNYRHSVCRWGQFLIVHSAVINTQHNSCFHTIAPVLGGRQC